MASEAHRGRKLSQDEEASGKRRKKKKKSPPPLALLPDKPDETDLVAPPKTIIGTLLATSGHVGTTYDLVDNEKFYIVKLPELPDYTVEEEGGLLEPAPIGGVIALSCDDIDPGPTTNVS
eukprot:gene27717-7362_t